MVISGEGSPRSSDDEKVVEARVVKKSNLKHSAGMMKMKHVKSAQL